MNKTEQAKNNDRLKGLIVFILGVALAFWQIISPILAARNGVTTVTVYDLGIGAGVVLPIVGTLMLFGGRKVNELLIVKEDKLTIVQVVLFLFVGIATLVGFIAVRTYIEDLGYEF